MNEGELPPHLTCHRFLDFHTHQTRTLRPDWLLRSSKRSASARRGSHTLTDLLPPFFFFALPLVSHVTRGNLWLFFSYAGFFFFFFVSAQGDLWLLCLHANENPAASEAKDAATFPGRLAVGAERCLLLGLEGNVINSKSCESAFSGEAAFPISVKKHLDGSFARSSIFFAALKFLLQQSCCGIVTVRIPSCNFCPPMNYFTPGPLWSCLTDDVANQAAHYHTHAAQKRHAKWHA